MKDWERRLLDASLQEAQDALRDAEAAALVRQPEAARVRQPEVDQLRQEDEFMRKSTQSTVACAAWVDSDRLLVRTEWTTEALHAEEAQILAELAALDASGVAPAARRRRSGPDEAAAPKSGSLRDPTPTTDAQRTTEKAARVVSHDLKFEHHQESDRNRQHEMVDDELVANWFEELPMLGLVLLLWLGLGAVRFITVYMTPTDDSGDGRKEDSGE